MRIDRNRLLITLILVAMASVTVSTASSALTRAVGIADPSWISAHEDEAGLNGEPDTGGNTVPPPDAPRLNGADRSRGEEPASPARDARLWLMWMSRIWAARLWGATY